MRLPEILRGRAYRGPFLFSIASLALVSAFSATIGCQDMTDTPPDSGNVKATRSPLIEIENPEVPVEAIDAALESLDQWRKGLGDTFPETVDERELYLGEPYLIYNVRIEDVIKLTALSEKNIVRKDAWYFPVLENDRYRFWIKVKKAPEGWRPAGRGGNAHRIQNLEMELRGRAASIRRSILRVVPLGLAFVAVEEREKSEGILSAEFYPYGLREKKEDGVEASLLDAVPTDLAGMLSLMKDTASAFQIKGIIR